MVAKIFIKLPHKYSRLSFKLSNLFSAFRQHRLFCLNLNEDYCKNLMPPDKLEFWIDMHLPSCLADWINTELKVFAKSFIELGYQTTSDLTIFKDASNNCNLIAITTKIMISQILEYAQYSELRILYAKYGNVANKTLRQIFD